MVERADRAAGGGGDAVEVEVREVRDDASGLLALIALPPPERGTAFGGIRRRRYASEEEARDDVLRLARQMELKVRLAGLSCGGAKAVILDHDGLDRPAAYGALGDAIEALGGRYHAGPDVGTTEADLDAVRARTGHVNDAGNDPGPSTARGVLAGALAALEHLGIAPDVVAVQGLGAVGMELTKALAAPERRLILADLDAAAGRAAAEAAVERGAEAETVSPGEILTSACDLLSPCALGPVLTADTVPGLRARVVCGSANGQLAGDGLADDLRRAGVLYVPDFLVNAGAVIEGVLAHQGAGRGQIEAALDQIGARTREILEEADARETTPLRIALERAGSAGP